MPFLAFNLNDGNEFVFDLIEDRLKLGRAGDNDIVIDNTYISAHHAEFLRQPDGAYELVDLQSSNGTFVNGKRIERSRLKGGDRLKFGELGARFRERPPRGAAPDENTGKTNGGSALEPSRANGRRGDTEAVPLADPVSPRKDTGKLEPASLTAVKMSGEEVTAFARVERLRREQAELEARRRQIEAEIAQTSGVREEVEAAAGELARLRAGCEAETARLNEARRETANLESRRESLQREIENARDDVERAQEGLRLVHEQVEQARAQLREETEEMERQRLRLEQESAKTRAEIEQRRDVVEALEQQTNQLRETLARLELERAAEERRLAAVKDDRAKAEHELSAAQERTQSLHLSMTGTENSLRILRDEISSLDRHLLVQKEAERELEERRAEALAALATLQDEKKTAETECAAARGRLDAMKQEISDCEQAWRKMETACSQLSEEKAALEAAAAQARAILKELEARTLNEESRAAELSAQQRLKTGELQSLDLALSESRRQQEHLMEDAKRLARQVQENQAALEDCRAKMEADLRQKQEIASSIAAMRQELAGVKDQAERWQQIEARLRLQLAELEEKHEVLRRGLRTDEATVCMFAQDIIKRLDLVDTLRERYAGTEMEGQLGVLRASLEDILLQHGISELHIEPGTPVDINLRRRIVVVENDAGAGQSVIAEIRRPGFVRVAEDGQERVLRKVEVSTRCIDA